MLEVTGPNGAARSLVSNKEKSKVLSHLFFPKKLAESFMPSGVLYPDCMAYEFWPSLEQLRRCVTRLAPHKAPGEDGIPNMVLKKSVELIAEYLLRIYKATFMLNTYCNKWRVWDTIVLQKPGKPRYDIPKAYRPIALMNTMAKLLSAMVMEDLVYMCEKYVMLLDNHFSSQPGCCTMDAMHLLVYKIKAAWQRGNVVAVLFLDVEGAFPNAVTTHLLHNLCLCRVLERYVLYRADAEGLVHQVKV